MSNLLAAGFQRFVADVYWDPGRAVWSLCPAEVPLPEIKPPSKNPPAVITVPSSLAESTSVSIASGSSVTTSLPQRRGIELFVRQDGESASESAMASSSSDIPSTLTSSDETGVPTSVAESASASTFPSDTNQHQLFQIGSYNCTATINLDLLADLLDNYLDGSDITTDATVAYLIMNIHAAASTEDPDGSAPQPEQMPVQGNLISDIIRGNLSEKLYTPHGLQDDRNNLNRSWLDVQWDNLPAPGYYQSSKSANGWLTTPDGWPTEAFMEFKEFYRLIAGFGAIDPQMSGYDLTTDLNNIFGPGVLLSLHSADISSSGSITQGCLFSASDTTITSSTNASWALNPAPQINLGTNPNTTNPILSITNLTSCGLSTLINTTLSNVTADQNPAPYRAILHSTLWTWAPGQPTKTTTENDNDYRDKCAVVSSSFPYPGRWRTSDCRMRRRVACQDPNNPYHWELSHDSVQYFSGDGACPRGLTFSVPHTALENAHLLSAIRASQSSTSPSPPSASDADQLSTVFLNLNTIDINNCWAIGVNATCPYLPRQDMDKTRVVVVPTVAAVIIFVLAALTFFVKCAANRREDKRGRRRRNVGGWEYEGVPS